MGMSAPAIRSTGASKYSKLSSTTDALRCHWARHPPPNQGQASTTHLQSLNLNETEREREREREGEKVEGMNTASGYIPLYEPDPIHHITLTPLPSQLLPVWTYQISAPTPCCGHPSSTVTNRDVFLTDALMVARSRGRMLRRLITCHVSTQVETMPRQHGCDVDGRMTNTSICRVWSVYNACKDTRASA